jgi:hypothetical protein
VFMNAKLIAVERNRDRIQFEDNDGKRKTLALRDDATLEGSLRPGTSVILAIHDDGDVETVTAVRRAETRPAAAPAPETAGPISFAAPAARVPGTNVLASGVADVQAGQSQFITGGGVGARGSVMAGIPTVGVASSPVVTDRVLPPRVPGASPRGAETSTSPTVGTTLQTGANFGAPNLQSLDSSNQMLTAPVQGTTIQSATGGGSSPFIIGDEVPRVGTIVSPSGTTTTTIGTTTGTTGTTGTISTTTTGQVDSARPISSNQSITNNNFSPTTPTSIVTTTSGGVPVSAPLVPLFTNRDLATASVAGFVNGGTTIIAGTPPLTAASTQIAAQTIAGQVPGSVFNPATLGTVIVPVGPGGGPIDTLPNFGSSPTVGSSQVGGLNDIANDGGLGADAVPLPIDSALRAYESAIARLSSRLPDVDLAFRRYRDACVGPASGLAAPGSFAWFGVWDGAQTRSETSDSCEPLLIAAVNMGEELQRGVAGAEDAGRRSGILPGVMRQIRTMYGMDWGGWDR